MEKEFMSEKIRVFTKRLGHERWLCDIDMLFFADNGVFPHKGDLIVLPIEGKEDLIADSEVYVVNQILLDYVHNEINMFVDLYNWED